MQGFERTKNALILWQCSICNNNNNNEKNKIHTFHDNAAQVRKEQIMHESYITYNAYQSYTCGTEIDISECLPEAFSDSYMYMYYNLMGTIKMYMLFCIVLFLLTWF